MFTEDSFGFFPAFLLVLVGRLNQTQFTYIPKKSNNVKLDMLTLPVLCGLLWSCALLRLVGVCSCIEASSGALFPTRRSISSNKTEARNEDLHHHLVPSIVHQIYDYQAPSFFLYLSIMCVQRYVQPLRHILWVNDEGRFRKGIVTGGRNVEIFTLVSINSVNMY
jgi:hypothetical protein